MEASSNVAQQKELFGEDIVSIFAMTCEFCSVRCAFKEQLLAFDEFDSKRLVWIALVCEESVNEIQQKHKLANPWNAGEPRG